MIAVLKKPAGRFDVICGVRFPIARMPALLADQPLSRASQSRVGPVQVHFRNGMGGNTCVPDRREAWLQAYRIPLLDYQPVQLKLGLSHLRVVRVVAETAE